VVVAHFHLLFSPRISLA